MFNFTDSSVNTSVILKHYISIGKQIGQINSHLVQNTVELQELSNEIKSAKKIWKNKCSCDHCYYTDVDSSDSNKNNDESGEDDTKQFDFPIENKIIFNDFNKQLETNPSYRNKLVSKLVLI